MINIHAPETLAFENHNSVTSSKNPQIHIIQKPLLSENSLTNNTSCSGTDCSGGEQEETTSRRRRKSRWDPPPEAGGSGTRKRKSRWADDIVNDHIVGIGFDPEIHLLNSRLIEISRMLQSGILPLDDRPEGARSPSPEPVYDNVGVRINTREYRARERLNKERQEIVSCILKRNPLFKPPADYRPPKVQKKLYIPVKEYPGYNFIGLIIGPRGNTQKRMERETGARILIRGKGSVKEGRLQKREVKRDPSENEDLHVLVEADTQEAVDAAVGMLEKLLHPVDEVLNEHKRQQLQELAVLNGTVRNEEYCRVCGEPGHQQSACSSRGLSFKSDVICKICGDGGHPTIDCPAKGSSNKKMDDVYRNYLAELGGMVPEALTKSSSSTLTIGPGSSGNGATSRAVGCTSQDGLKPLKEYDETNLFVGYIPPTLDDDTLIQLFTPFGKIVRAKVVKDHVTGLSKGYGFVKYSDVQQAVTAIANMNGHFLDGRSIAVRVAEKRPQPVLPPVLPAPVPGSYPSQRSVTGAAIGSAPLATYTGNPASWYPPGPLTSALYTPPPSSTMYPHVMSPPLPTLPPYGVQYPVAVPTISFPATSLTVPSSNMQQSVQPAYPTPTFSYAPCYGVPAPLVPLPTINITNISQSTTDHSHITANVPWAQHTVVPLSTNKSSVDTVSEKFMAETK